jgi:hypothetical protein
LTWRELTAQILLVAALLLLPAVYRRFIKPLALALWRDRARPPVFSSIVAFAVAYPVRFYLAWNSVDLGASSTAAIGLLFVPLVAAFEALPWAGVGYAIGSVVRAWRTHARRHLAMAALGVGVSISWLVYLAVDFKAERALIATVAEVAAMEDAGLRSFLDTHEHRSSRYALGAVAMNRNAGGATLARIAALDDPALHEKFGGVPELMRGNRKGLAVMRLVIGNPNVEPATLHKLAASRDPYVLGDVAGHKGTPLDVIERLYAQRETTAHAYLIEWGLAANVAAPSHILRALAKDSRDRYTLYAVANNSSAPTEARKLAEDRIRRNDYRPY